MKLQSVGAAVGLIAMMTAVDSKAATDPYPWMDCSYAKSESQKKWYDSSDTSGYNYKITQKLKWCSSSSSTSAASSSTSTTSSSSTKTTTSTTTSSSSSGAEPYTWLTCSKAESVAKQNWYDPTATDKTNYSYKVATKLKWCGSSSSSSSTASTSSSSSTTTKTASNTTSTSTVSQSSATSTATSGSYAAVCSKWTPGNYIRVMHDPDRSKNILDEIQFTMNELKAANAESYFKGFLVHFAWGHVEKSKGVYDFSMVDKAIAKINQSGFKHMRVMLHLEERTHFNGCSSTGFAPGYVARVDSTPSISTDKQRKCFAKTWEPTTALHYRNAVDKMLTRYRNNPKVLGVVMAGEASIKGQPASTFTQLFKRFKEHSVYFAKKHPNMMIVHGTNWQSRATYEDLASTLVKTPGGFTWPDTVPSGYPAQRSSSLLKASSRHHYDVAAENSNRMLVMPMIQSPFIDSDFNQTKAIYNYLNHEVGAQMPTWENAYWGPDSTSSSWGRRYLSKSVIPVVKAYGGKLQNTSCPF